MATSPSKDAAERPISQVSRVDPVSTNITDQSDPNGKPLYAYTGREWDPDADLYYYRARWYDAKVGRFISEDPLGFAAGDPNVSRYVGNEPSNSVDPSGMFEEPEQVGLIIGSNLDKQVIISILANPNPVDETFIQELNGALTAVANDIIGPPPEMNPLVAEILNLPEAKPLEPTNLIAQTFGDFVKDVLTNTATQTFMPKIEVFGVDPKDYPILAAVGFIFFDKVVKNHINKFEMKLPKNTLSTEFWYLETDVEVGYKDGQYFADTAIKFQTKKDLVVTPVVPVLGFSGLHLAPLPSLQFTIPEGASINLNLPPIGIESNDVPKFLGTPPAWQLQLEWPFGD